MILLDPRQNTCQSVFVGDDQGPDGREAEQDLSLVPDDPLLTLLAHEKALITTYDVAERQCVEDYTAKTLELI